MSPSRKVPSAALASLEPSPLLDLSMTRQLVRYVRAVRAELFCHALDEFLVRQRAAALARGRERDVHLQGGRPDPDLVARGHPGAARDLAAVDLDLAVFDRLQRHLLAVPAQRRVVALDVGDLDPDIARRIVADGAARYSGTRSTTQLWPPNLAATNARSSPVDMLAAHLLFASYSTFPDGEYGPEG